VHAGWRGVVAGVLVQTLTQMAEVGVKPQDVLLAIGPSIGPDSFEVGEEVAAEFDKAFSPSPVLRRPGQKPHVDLGRALAQQARDFGLTAGQIDIGKYCTVRNHDLFFSHRRDKGVTGRMAAVIATTTERRA
jgi:YfiH family protein